MKIDVLHPQIPLDVSHGGTGATTASEARTALELAAVAASGSYADLSNKPDTAKGEQLDLSNAFTGAAHVGKLRYTMAAGTSKCEMYMQINASAYGWVNILTNTWVA